MEIVWIGHSCFRLRGRDATVITDPCPKPSGYNLARATAYLVTVSNDHPNHSASEDVAGERTVLNGRAEYEVRCVIVTGVRTNAPFAGWMRNTASTIDLVEDGYCQRV